MDADRASWVVIGVAIKVHQGLGPGLLESVYEAVLARKLAEAGLQVERQRHIDFTFDGVLYQHGFIVDLLINECLVIELKSTEAVAPVHKKQVLTYLKLMNLHLGLLLNFGAPTMKEGVVRLINGAPTPSL